MSSPGRLRAAFFLAAEIKLFMKSLQTGRKKVK